MQCLQCLSFPVLVHAPTVSSVDVWATVTISLHYYCYSLMGLLLLFKRLKLCGCEKEERRDGGEKVVSDEMCQVWFDNRSRRLLLI